MSKLLQDPNVSEKARKLIEAAEAAGMDLPDYIHAEYEKTREKISIQDLIRRIESEEPVDMSDIAKIIREERESRARHLYAVTRTKRR